MIFKVVTNTDVTIHNLSGQKFKDFMHDHVRNGEPMEEMHFYKGSYIFNKAVPSESGTIPWTFSTHDVDRANDVVIQSGWELGNYQKCPVILWAHDHSRPAIGLGVDVRVEGEKLIGGFQPVPKTIDHFGWSIGEKAKLGILRAGSVGFMPYEFDFEDDEESGEEYLFFKRQELLEFSICNVPMNPLALQDPDFTATEVTDPGSTEQAVKSKSLEEIIGNAVDIILSKVGVVDAEKPEPDHIDHQEHSLPWRKNA